MVDEKRGDTFVMRGEPAGKDKPIGFSTFLLGIASSALIHLGAAPHPETGRTEKVLPLAKQSLDLLVMLRDKTQGNLSAEEETLFKNLLADLQIRYVEASRT